MTEYDDGRIICRDTELVIRLYDALLMSKQIRYEQIRSARRVALGFGRRWRIWGSGDFRHWWNFDEGRPNKQVAFVLDVGKHWQPVVTPDDPHQFADALRAHGVAVESGTL